MKELTLVEREGIYYADSREVAEMTGKHHAHLMRDIKGYMTILNESNFGSVDFFKEDKYLDGKGEIRPCYLITRKGCDMVANKMTGEKGVLFTAAYVTQFEQMEKQLKGKKMISSTFKEKEAEARLRNSRVREAQTWLKIADRVNIPEYKHIMSAKAAETLAGIPILPLQKTPAKTYTATEIGNILGVSANKIGKLANSNGVKIKEYGIEVWDKSPHSAKQIPSWRYYEKAIPVFRHLLSHETKPLEVVKGGASQ